MVVVTMFVVVEMTETVPVILATYTAESSGMIATPMGLLEMEKQPAMKIMLERTPLARLGEAHEIASVVAFLCSPAAAFVTGCDLVVDGGVCAALGIVR